MMFAVIKGVCGNQGRHVVNKSFLLIRCTPSAVNHYSSISTDTETNPLLRSKEFPEFKSIKAEHVVTAVNKLVADFQRGVEDLEEQLQTPDFEISWSSVADPIEKIQSPLNRSWSVVVHLNAVKNSQELRDAYQQAQPYVVKATTRLTQSVPLYNALKKLQETQKNLNRGQHRIIESALRSARLGGVELNGTVKTRFNEINLRLATLSNLYSNNLLDSTKDFKLVLTDSSDVEGIPDSLKQLMANNAVDDKTKADPENGPWKVTLDMPCYEPFMKHIKNRQLRERVYKAFISRASVGKQDNSDIVEEFRFLRHEKAVLLGYPNFAAMALTTRVADHVDKVWDFLLELKDKTKHAARRELEQVQTFAASNGFKDKLQHWDIEFWSQRRRESILRLNDEDLRPYLPLDRVLQGMFDLTTLLFDVKVKAADGLAETWHTDVRFFRILDANGEHIASFYLDPYTRPIEKNGGAWMWPFQNKSDLLKTKPVGFLMCNQMPPLEGRPSLMTFREAEILFHELGHGLQHMLTTVQYPAAAGMNNIEWDAVELPSQFMQNWLYDRNTLRIISGHYKTGERLPESTFEKLLEARKYMAGSNILRQLYLAALDMELHTSSDPWRDVMTRIAADYTILPPLPEDRLPCSFLHIFTALYPYAAGYYSYKWAEVMSADAFAAFEEVGLDNKQAMSEVGSRFRNTILALGGSAHPSDVFRMFRGREQSIEALLNVYGL